jgi:hypothetical protein
MPSVNTVALIGGNARILFIRGTEMELNTQETTLLEAFRRLPPNAADELSSLVQRLAALSPNKGINWSDSWSDEDLRDFTTRSLERLDAEEESR